MMVALGIGALGGLHEPFSVSVKAQPWCFSLSHLAFARMYWQGVGSPASCRIQEVVDASNMHFDRKG